MEPRQLLLVFADSPQGGKGEEAVGEPTGKAYLLQRARVRKAKGITATAAAPERLLEEVASPANLADALLRVARNQGAPGVDGKTVGEVVQEAHRLLPRLRDKLLSGNYLPGDVRRVWIPKPGGQRGLGIPNVVDRWVQQAVSQVLAPVFEPGFHQSSHGFRPTRGAQTAIDEAKKHVAAGLTWLVSVDLSKFFDRVNHQRLLARMGRQVSDGRILKLVHRMLKAKVVLPDGARVSTDEGTPQGGPLSPLLSNIVLDELDWELERRGLRFVRYADDFNVFVGSERAGHRVMASLTRFIERRLRLRVNVAKSAVARPEKVHFLGFSLRDGAGGVEVHLSERSQKALAVKIRELTPRNSGRSLDSYFEQLNPYLRGWIAYFRLVTREGLRPIRYADAHIRRRLRAVIVHQKKRSRFLCRHLLERGVPPTVARHSAWNGGPWKKSASQGMHKAYKNKWFHERLVCLKSQWQLLNSRVVPPHATATEQLLLFQ